MINRLWIVLSLLWIAFCVWAESMNAGASHQWNATFWYFVVIPPSLLRILIAAGRWVRKG